MVGRGAEAAQKLGERPDVLIDTVGGEGVADLIQCVRPGGRAVLVGHTAGRTCPLDLPSWLLSDVRLIPVNTVTAESWAPQRLATLGSRFVSGELTIRLEKVGIGDIPPILGRAASG